MTVHAAWAADPDAFKIAGVVAFSGAYGIIGEDMKRGATITDRMPMMTIVMTSSVSVKPRAAARRGISSPRSA